MVLTTKIALFWMILAGLTVLGGCSDYSDQLTSALKTQEPPKKLIEKNEIVPSKPDASVDRRLKISGDQAVIEDSVPNVEPVGRFIVPTEYFTIRSRYFPDAICAVSLPADYNEKPSTVYPMVIAFGGAGECSKSPRQGSLAWVSYYKADEAAKALASSHLSSSDFRGLVTREQLDKFNRLLKKNPYSGVILVCPYSPLLTPHNGLEIPEYEKYIMEELIPALCSHYRVDRSRLGVDGVSMGGARSMYYGFKYPEIFSRVGSVQAAVGPFMDTYRHLLNSKGNQIKKSSIQIVSSDLDVFLKSIEKFSSMLDSMGMRHSLLVLKGPHDYIFNQGPGSLALLSFHGSQNPKASQGPVR